MERGLFVFNTHGKKSYLATIFIKSAFPHKQFHHFSNRMFDFDDAVILVLETDSNG